MEDQIIGIAFWIIILAAIGIAAFKSNFKPKRRWGTNPPDAKYPKGRR